MTTVNHVLLVDDDPMCNVINEKIIRVSQFAQKVGIYLDPNHALNDLRQIVKTDRADFPGIIFLDINMPEMNGWEFLDELNKFPRSVLMECKVFMLTSSTNKEDIEKSKAYNLIQDFISKPLTPDKLEAIFSPQHEAGHDLV